MNKSIQSTIWSTIQSTIQYIFPREFTFWTVLYYIFLFYLVSFIVFNIYIYMNDLEYEIDCENHDKCFIIYSRGTKVPPTTPSL